MDTKAWCDGKLQIVSCIQKVDWSWQANCEGYFSCSRLEEASATIVQETPLVIQHRKPGQE
jgi:hypothetical protein